MGTISLSLPADGTTADVADVNTPFTTIANVINGNLDTNNLSATAAIATGQIATGAITNAKLSTTAGEVGGAYTTWTPTWANLTVGNGTLNYAQYTKVGKTVKFRLKFTFGNSSAMGTNPTFTLPSTSVSTYDTLGSALGPCYLRDASPGSTVLGNTYWVSTTTASPTNFAVSGSLLGRSTFTSTAPFTWTTNDYLECSGQYEEA